MKLVKTIVDEQNRLVGFMVEGTDAEFSGLPAISSQNTVVKPFSLAALSKLGFSNSQISMENNTLKIKRGFSANTLPCVVYHDINGGTFEPVDNTLNILSRVLVNGELKGFDVQMFNGVARVTYDNLIRYTTWCKPGNFVLRTTNTKTYIAGKPGVMRLSDLPEKEIGNQVETGKRKRTSFGGQQTDKVKNQPVQATGDLLSLYKMVQDCDGLIIKLPNEQYTAHTEAKDRVSSEFTPLNIGEISSPYLVYGDKKVNANSNFKKVGTVLIEMGGIPAPIYTFTWSTKSIFVAGKNHMQKFAIGVTPEVSEQIIEVFGKALIAGTITDKKFTQPIAALTGKKDLVFFKIDTTQLEVMSQKDAELYLMPDETLFSLVSYYTSVKAMQKLLRGAKKYYESQATQSELAQRSLNKPLFGLFAQMNRQSLLALEEAGIDIHTGAFTKREKIEPSEAMANKPEKATESVPEIEIEFEIKGSGLSKIDFATVVKEITSKNITNPLCDEQMQSVVNWMLKAGDTASTLDYIEAIAQSYDNMSKSCCQELWLHKMAMISLGKDSGNLVMGRGSQWEEVASRSKKAHVYQCKTPQCENLVMKITGARL